MLMTCGLPAEEDGLGPDRACSGCPVLKPDMALAEGSILPMRALLSAEEIARQACREQEGVSSRQIWWVVCPDRV